MDISTKNLLFLALSVLLLSSCSRNPTNNPFDGKYNVSHKKLQENGYQALNSNDEFWGYEKTFDRYSLGYVYFADAPRVNGKDFTYYIDTLIVDTSPSAMASDAGYAIIDSFHQSPWRLAPLEGTLLLFDAEIAGFNGDEIQVISNGLPYSLLKRTDMKPLGDKVMLVRSINGYIYNPNFEDPPTGVQILTGILVGAVIVAEVMSEDEIEEECE